MREGVFDRAMTTLQEGFNIESLLNRYNPKYLQKRKEKERIQKEKAEKEAAEKKQ